MQHVRASFDRILPKKKGLVVVHSALHGLRLPERDALQCLLRAFCEYVEGGWTFAFPAFTYSFCGGARFDIRLTPSETGMLADLALEHLPNAIRTRHPIYSHVTAGPKSGALMALQPSTAFGEGSIFEYFEKAEATVVMMGCGWRFNTQFHRYEELAGVPYRFAKTFRGEVDLGQGEERTAATMFVRDLDLDPKNDFFPAVDELRRCGAIRASSLWDGPVEACDVTAMASVCRAQLDVDPLVYLENAPAVRKRLSDRSERENTATLRIGVFSRSNTRIMERAWYETVSKVLPEREVEVAPFTFGQLPQALIASESEARSYPPTIRVFYDRLEDVAGDDFSDVDAVSQSVESWADTVRSYHEDVGGWSIVHTFARFEAVQDSEAVRAAHLAINQANNVLIRVLSDVEQIVWVDMAAEAAGFEEHSTDKRLWHLGRFAFSEPFSKHLAQRWTAFTLSVIGKSARLIICDLDNTLWGGVVGEDGPSNLQIGGDYPGNAYAALQRELIKLHEKGIALAICSKNDEDLALGALENLPECPVCLEMIAAHRINWEPKWSNVQEICSEMGLGLASALFVDDNPVEREAMRRNLPEVKVLELPKDPAQYANTLANSIYVGTAVLTMEDRKRAQNYRAQKVREHRLTRATSIEDYLCSLNLVAEIVPLSVGNAQRAAQLCQKTNQFNATTKRYDQAALWKLADEGADVVLLSLEDEFSSREIVGLMIVCPGPVAHGTIDTLLLSCRVLGRGVETVLPLWSVQRAAKRGWDAVLGEIFPTERNTPVRSVYEDAQFTKVDSTTWKHKAGDVTYPTWVSVTDTVE